MNDAELEMSIQIYGRRRPFAPFLLEFTSGAQVLIHHPDALARFRQVWLYRGPKKSQAVFPSASVCRLLDLPHEADEP